jgi:hypothetical protein
MEVLGMGCSDQNGLCHATEAGNMGESWKENE